MDPTSREIPAPPDAPDGDPARGADSGGAPAAGESDAAESEAGPIEAPASAAEVAALRAKVAALEDKVRRQAAEFVNDTRRIRQQAEDRARYAAEPVVSDLLGVVDALHNAIHGLQASEHERRVSEGLRLVERELIEALARHGVARIDAAGKPFDPAFHQAILETDAPGPPRSVVQVVRPGFTLHGRVVRPAHVIVSKAAGTSSPPAPAGGTEADGDA
jgi:molecular chaperone GrpE